MNEIYLKPGREHSIAQRHPWIFSGAIAKINGIPGIGGAVRVLDETGKFLAHGVYSPESAIAVKIWSFDEAEEIGEALFARRLESAYRLRLSVFGGTLPDAFRLVNAESDSMPGLVADVYGKFCVCQITGAAAEKYRDILARLLLQYAPEGVYERSDLESRTRDGLSLRTGLIAGNEPPDEIEFTENGIRFSADPRHGQKTGFYLDQRMNRLAVMNGARGCENVLNCFCYTGGFGLAALAGGAKNVLNIDASEEALALAVQNAARNGFGEDRFQTQAADVFQFLRTCRDSRKTFDLIVLDPPKFADSIAQKDKAARGYKDINLLALKLLRPGGKLYTFSCSGAMDAPLFEKVVASAALDAGVDLRLTARLAQGPDHPVSAAFPEGFYLKGLAGIVAGTLPKFEWQLSPKPVRPHHRRKN